MTAPFDTLDDFAARWRDDPVAHGLLRGAFVAAADGDPWLDAHRTHVESHALGFGDRSFHWLWKLVVDSLPQRLSFCEVGVFCGQVVTLVASLAARTGRAATVVGVSGYDGRGTGWPADYEPRVRDFWAWTRANCPDARPAGGQDPWDDVSLTTVRGDSVDPETVETAAALGPYDCVFVDGGHTTEIAAADLRNYAPLVRVGGLLVVDDCANRFPQPWGFFAGIREVSDAVDAALPPFGPADAFGCRWRHLGNVMHDRVWRRET